MKLEFLPIKVPTPLFSLIPAIYNACIASLAVSKGLEMSIPYFDYIDFNYFKALICIETSSLFLTS